MTTQVTVLLAIVAVFTVLSAIAVIQANIKK